MFDAKAALAEALLRSRHGVSNMGGFTKDILVGGMLHDLNQRFGPVDGIKEMAGLQKTFGVFSPQHSLKDSLALLNIGPVENWSERRGWYKYLDSLKNLPSDKSGQSAHDRIVEALGSHLASRDPLPVHFVSHSTSTNQGVRISQTHTPLPHSTQEFLTISLPMTPVEKDRAKRRAAS
jgi:hypothetical protein